MCSLNAYCFLPYLFVFLIRRFNWLWFRCRIPSHRHLYNILKATVYCQLIVVLSARFSFVFAMMVVFRLFPSKMPLSNVSCYARHRLLVFRCPSCTGSGLLKCKPIGALG